MNYYQHHIGDFIKDTSFLSNEETGIYLKLLWLYYDTEKPLPDSILSLTMKVGAKGNQASVEGILNMFFTYEDGLWRNKRCDEEILNYRKKQEVASKAGKASAAQRALNERSTDIQQSLNGCSTDVQQSLNGCSTDVQRALNKRSTNHKPLTINQEPVSYSNSNENKNIQLDQEHLFPFAPNDDEQGTKTEKATTDVAIWSQHQGKFEIPISVIERLQLAYPACDIERQAAAAGEWIIANPTKQKKNYHRFLCNWLSRAQEKGGDARFAPQQSELKPSSKQQEPKGWKGIVKRELPDKQFPETWEDCDPTTKSMIRDILRSLERENQK